MVKYEHIEDKIDEYREQISHESRVKQIGRRVMGVVGCVIPVIDLVKEREGMPTLDNYGRRVTRVTKLRMSGRVSVREVLSRLDRQSFYVPSPEWSSAGAFYGDLVDTPEKEAAFVASFEDPPMPQVAEPATKKEA
jgi:hypothetical protein